MSRINKKTKQRLRFSLSSLYLPSNAEFNDLLLTYKKATRILENSTPPNDHLFPCKNNLSQRSFPQFQTIFFLSVESQVPLLID